MTADVAFVRFKRRLVLLNPCTIRRAPCLRIASSEVIVVNGSLVLRVALPSRLIPNAGGLIIGLDVIAEARLRGPQP